MSHKRNRTCYSHRKPSVSVPSTAPSVMNPVLARAQFTEGLLSAMDGYSNAAAFIGEDSPLMSAGTFIRSGLTAQSELLTTTYRVSWLAKRIIDMPSEDMTRAWYRLSTSLPEGELDVLRRLERHLPHRPGESPGLSGKRSGSY